MFERYTEKARRVISFARYEASQFGSPLIETEHLLLGLLREDKPLSKLILRSGVTEESIRAQIAARHPAGENIATSLVMPLSRECERVLAHAAEEAERLSHMDIGTGHLLLGLVREEKGLAAEILHAAGLELVPLRHEILRPGDRESASERLRLPPLLSEMSRDLSEAAQRAELDPLIGRAAQFERMLQILCRSERNNVALVGSPGVGKQAAVECLAYRVAKGDVPARLDGFRIIHIVLSPIVALLRESARVQDRLKDILQGLASPAKTIFYVEGLFDQGAAGTIPIAQLLRPLLSMSEMQCIAVATPREFQKAAEKEPWLEECFQVVELSAPTVEEAFQILLAVKPRYERFHGVQYTEEALHQAVALSVRYLPNCCLPDVAIDLMDDAGSACAVRSGSVSEEVKGVQKRLKAVKLGMENAIAQREFDKARFYSIEADKGQRELQDLLEKHNLAPAAKVVGPAEVEEAVARRAGIPVEKVRQESGSKSQPDKSEGQTPPAP